MHINYGIIVGLAYIGYFLWHAVDIKSTANLKHLL